MIELQYEDQVTPVVQKYISALQDRRTLHAEMAMAVETKVLRHIREVKVPQGNALGATSTGFWQKALASVTATSNGYEGKVSIPYKGVALQYYGGTINKREKKLTIPINPLAHGKSVAEIKRKLYRFLSVKGNWILATEPTKAERLSYQKSRAKKQQSKAAKRTGKRIAPYRGGTPLYVLKDKVTVSPHEDVLPAIDELNATVTNAASNYVARRLEV